MPLGSVTKKGKTFSDYADEFKKKGEVDFLVDDRDNLTVLPLEIKSGKDYTDHCALTSVFASIL